MMELDNSVYLNRKVVHLDIKMTEEEPLNVFLIITAVMMDIKMMEGVTCAFLSIKIVIKVTKMMVVAPNVSQNLILVTQVIKMMVQVLLAFFLKITAL